MIRAITISSDTLALARHHGVPDVLGEIIAEMISEASSLWPDQPLTVYVIPTEQENRNEH